MWSRLRKKRLGNKFRRQHSIGRYIVDFYCPAGKLVIEIDGSQHLDNQEHDRQRDLYLMSLGLKVLRFWNSEVNNNLEGVLARIMSHLPSGSPPQRGGEEHIKNTMKKLAVLGSTGSIGTQALEVVDNLPGDFDVVALTTNTKVDLLREQIKKYEPEYVVVGDEGKRAELVAADLGRTQILFSSEELIKEAGADLILNALSGVAGIVPTLEAVKAGVDVALANKESLVAAGDIIMKLAREKKVNIYPVDSEHSAIWQCLRGEKEKEVKKIIITCSGGPFRGKKRDELKNITVEQALDHPTWSMGGKITIDSSTLMNKGLEVIEAYQLFDVTPEQIEVVVHPQSIVHSAVEFADGSIKAQLGPHDMRIAIQYALTYPAHKPSPAEDFSLTDVARLDFEEPDLEAFPCLAYAFAALKAGGTMPAVVNAANEAAVMLFLDGKIKYLDIPQLIKEAMDKHEVVAEPDFAEIMQASEWAGKIVADW